MCVLHCPAAQALWPCKMVLCAASPVHALGNLSALLLHDVQVIVERADKSNIPDIDKKK